MGQCLSLFREPCGPHPKPGPSQGRALVNTGTGGARCGSASPPFVLEHSHVNASVQPPLASEGKNGIAVGNEIDHAI